jgi:hypothetical protein
MAQERKTSEVVMCDGVPVANYRGISRLLWYIYDRKVSRVDAGRLIHEYAVAWADNRDKVFAKAAPVSGTQPTLKGEAQSAT